MRNLKRALSLTLASVMLLGMMVVGAGAAGFPDVDDENNVEAIEVLNAVDVIRGYDNGDFGPDDLVTRAQMAVIMANLLNLDYQYYEATCPFTDVPAWARGYVGACYAKGITSGYSATIYGPNDGITPVQAASMMMRALGYFKYSQDYSAGFEVATVSQGTQVGIFEGVGSSATAQMTRNQVAQMALNALKSEMVTFTGTPGIEVNGVVVGYRAEYTARTSTESKYQSIERRTSDVSGGNNLNRGQYYVQLGEELYNGDLKLNDDSLDVFGRPARTWSYKGTEVGTYAKKELLVHEAYTDSVKGREVYDLLGQSTIRDNDLIAYLDGYVNGNNSVGNLVKDNLVRSNNTNLAGTGRGVLTEIYLDNDKELITIVSINTYLAQANSDYNASAENVSLTVYDSNGGITKLVDLEDVPGIADLKKDDWMLVNWADESNLASAKVVVDMFDVEIMENVEVTGFASKTEDYSNWNAGNDASRKVTDITTSGTTYKANAQAWYKQNTLNNYSDDRLVDKTYTLYMDQYGYFIGAELYSGQSQYVFITGYDRPGSAIGMTTAKANGIFTDGTMSAIDVNVSDTNKNIAPNGVPKAGYTTWTQDQNHEEMWYTYSVRNNVYTLTPVDGWTRTFATAADTVIDCSNVRLVPSATGATYGSYVSVPANSNGVGNAYGEDASVYITAEMGDVTQDGNKPGPSKKGVTEITGRYTGVQDVKLIYQPGSWAHAVYDSDNNYIIACVVLGEAEGVVDNYAYIRGGAKNERIERDTNGDYVHYWDVEVIMDGVKDTKTIKSKYSNTTSQLRPGTVQELILDSDGYVTKINILPNALNASGVEVSDTALTIQADEVYSNYDYLHNLTKNGKPNSTDLADYNVYDIDVNTSAFNSAATGVKGAYTQDGSSYYYNTMTLQGRTLKFDASNNDEGLAIMADAKAVIRHFVNGEWVYDDCGTVAEAFNLINDADRNGSNNPTNGKQFSGRVVAVLNSTGRAEWVFFQDNTKPQTNRPGYDPVVTGESIDPNSDLTRVQQLLNDGKDVVINGTWRPRDLSATHRTLIIPADRTLTVLGDLYCYQNDGTNNIVIGADGTGSRTGKLVVRAGNGGSGTFEVMTQSVNFPVEAANVVFRTGTATNPKTVYNITRDMTVSGNFTMRGGNVVNLTSGTTLSVAGTISSYGSDTASLTVNGTAYVGSVSDTIIYVYSSNSLHVSGTVTTTGVIVVGDGTSASNNGYADIKTLAGKLIVKNMAGARATEVEETTTTAQISINNSTSAVAITEKNETNKVAMAAGATLTLPPTVNSTTNPGLLVDEVTKVPVTTTTNTTITASSNIGTLITNESSGSITDPAKVEVSDDMGGVEKNSPIEVEARIITNGNDFANAVAAGFKPDGNNTTWGSVQAYGKSTLPWLVVKVTPVVALEEGTKIVATVKLNGQELGQLNVDDTDTQNVTETKETWTIGNGGRAAGQPATFHWEMGKCETNSSEQLNQVGGAKSGTYTVSFEVTKGDTTLVAPQDATASYTAPPIAVVPTAVNNTLIGAAGDNANNNKVLPADGQSFDVRDGMITVSKAFDMETYGDYTFGGMTITGQDNVWFTQDQFTHFIVVGIQRPTEDSDITHFTAVSAGAPNGNTATIGTGDPGYLLFAWNENTGASSAPVTIHFGPNANDRGTGWTLNLDYSALKK